MQKKTIGIITGASGGFGREFVKLCLNESLDEIWAIARNKEKLDTLVRDYGEKIKTFPLDLSNRKNIFVIKNALENENVTVQYLINNAGFTKFCSYCDIDLSESLNMIDLNVISVVALGLVCIPYMQKGSHIINIASQASFFPLPYQNIYAATKAFVRNYTRALNVELKSTGITATAVCPGWMKTGLFERAKIGAKKTLTKFTGIVMPSVVAKRAMKDAKKGKDISVYGAFNKTTHILSKILPQRLVMKIWLMTQGI